MFNNEFIVIKNPQFFVNGELVFPGNSNGSDGTYRTVFGPSFSHRGTIYANCDYNVNFAIRRLTGTRCPMIPGKHARLFQNQIDFIAGHKDQLKVLKDQYESTVIEYTDALLEAELHHADLHPKRAIRIEAWAKLQEEGIGLDHQDPWVIRPWWKMKKDEYSKPGKKPRMIVDLGVAASLRGFRLAEFLKQAQAEQPFEYLGGYLQFIKTPDPQIMAEVFKNLIDPPGRFYFVYFSDDSCFAHRVNGVVYRHNIDISSCDSSHTKALFTALRDLLPPSMAEDMDVLIKQCSLPLKIVSTNDRKLKVTVKPTGPKLYSGSTITTAINNLANLLIGMALAEMVYIGPQSIVLAAERAGYIVTGEEPLDDWHDLQFLKHSPMLDISGEVCAVLNFGVLVRASGTCKGDLPGRGNLRERGELFQRGLVNSAYPRLSTPLVNAMRSGLPPAPVTNFINVLSDDFSFKVVTRLDLPVCVVSTFEFTRRYRHLSQDDDELLRVLTNMEYGREYGSVYLGHILTVDYQLGCTESLAPECVTPLHFAC